MRVEVKHPFGDNDLRPAESDDGWAGVSRNQQALAIERRNAPATPATGDREHGIPEPRREPDRRENPGRPEDGVQPRPGRTDVTIGRNVRTGAAITDGNALPVSMVGNAPVICASTINGTATDSPMDVAHANRA